MDNYDSDYRVTSARESKWYSRIDTNKMRALVQNYDDEPFWVPFEFEVCPVCDGRGKHVNPSIDCNGLTAEDFGQDPDFREDYFSGVYDVTCGTCHGKNVVPVCTITEEHPNWKAWEYFQECRQEIADMYAEMAAERRMGA